MTRGVDCNPADHRAIRSVLRTSPEFVSARAETVFTRYPSWVLGIQGKRERSNPSGGRHLTSSFAVSEVAAPPLPRGQSHTIADGWPRLDSQATRR